MVKKGFSVRANSTPCVQMPICAVLEFPLPPEQRFSCFAGKYQITSGSITIWAYAG
jgi:hypothetical protein